MATNESAIEITPGASRSRALTRIEPPTSATTRTSSVRRELVDTSSLTPRRIGIAFLTRWAKCALPWRREKSMSPVQKPAFHWARRSRPNSMPSGE